MHEGENDTDRRHPHAGLIGSDWPASPAISRRSMLRGSASAGSAVLLPLLSSSCATTGQVSPPVLSAAALATLAAVADRLIPSDELGPGATDSGALRYIERSLADWNRSDISLLETGLAALERSAHARHDSLFPALAVERQDALLADMEAGLLPDFTDAAQVFNRIHRLVLEGMFSDPYYGGNAGFAGWDLIGYPGAVLSSTEEMQRMGGRLPALHTSAYGAEHDGH